MVTTLRWCRQPRRRARASGHPIFLSGRRRIPTPVRIRLSPSWPLGHVPVATWRGPSSWHCVG